MSDNKSKSTSKKGEEKKNKQHQRDSEKDETEENDYGGLPPRKLGKNLGCGG